MATQETMEQLARDMREGKINRPPRPPNAEPLAPYGTSGNPFREFPKMLYNADYLPACEEYENARRRLVKADDIQRDIDIKNAQERKDKATRVVDTSAEERSLGVLGWYPSPTEAKTAAQTREADTAVDAAVRAYDDRHLSDRAKAEVEAHEEATNAHVTDMPSNKRGRKPAGDA